jgi:biotin transport system substrate-specific component
MRHLALIAAGVLIVSLSAQIYIPTQPVPFTGQTFGVLLVGGALGFRRAAIALVAYILIGSCGVPVFSEGRSGFAVLTGFTGGYIIGFAVAAAIIGRLAELGWDRRVGGAIGAMLIGNAVIYAFGLPWLAVTAELSPAAAIATGVTPFVVWDLVKLGLAGAAFPLAWWVVGRRPGDR